MRSEIFDEPNDTSGIADRDVVRFPGDGLVEHQEVGPGSVGGQSSGLPESSHSHQDVAVIAGYEGRVDAQVPGYGRPGPATGEGSPRPIQSFEREVTEVGLQQNV